MAKQEKDPRGKAKGKSSAPGQIKQAGEKAIGKAKGKAKKDSE
ncbi:hypothetical protein [Dehalogenimonas etheniformans]|nr:hypothetical protein [Dehalogenimonas etheniformans]